MSCPAAAVLDTSLYVLGGVHDDYAAGSYVFHDHLYRLDTVARHWTRLSTGPSARAFATCVADQGRGRLYVFGGTRYDRITPTGVDGYHAFDELWAYEAATDRWELLSTGDGGPAGRASPAMWLHQDRLYVFGGAGPRIRTYADLWTFDLATRTWRDLTGPPAPRGRLGPAHDVCPSTTRLLLCAGENVEFGDGGLAFTLLSDTWAYDPAAGTWTDLTPEVGSPTPASYAVGAVLDGVMHLHGGDIPGGAADALSPVAQNPSAEHWALDGTWRRLPDGPRLKCHAGGVVDGRLHLVGGYDFTDSGQTWNRDVHTYHEGEWP
jgi:N-acetylneuraminic acid mutarotase